MKAYMILSLLLLINFINNQQLEFHLTSANNQDLITEINSSQTTWKAGFNSRFNNLTVADAQKLCGALETPLSEKLPLKKINIVSDLPENFDLRKAHPECSSLSEIRDQSACGSCWAIAAVEAMSDRVCLFSKGKLQTRISTENLLSCCTYCGNGCNGGYPHSAWNYWKDHGLPTGGLYQDFSTCQPYSFPPCDHHVEGKYGPCKGDYPTPKCLRKCNPKYPKSFGDDLYYAFDSYFVGSNEEEIKSEIFTNGSVEAAFSVYEDFLTYKSGVYKHVKGRSLGGHAIKIIGWGVEEGTKYWIVVNSWNQGWGDEGTFKILRGEDHLGIESEVVAGTPKLNSQYLTFLQ